MSASCTKEFSLNIASLPQVPFAYFKMDEADPIFSLANQYGDAMGLLVGSAGSSTPGKIGTALVVSDGRTFQTLPNASWVCTTEFSIRLWYRAVFSFFVQPVIKTDQFEVFVDWTNGTHYIFHIQVFTTAGTKGLVSEAVTGNTNPPVTLSDWHMMVCTFKEGFGLTIRVDNGTDDVLSFTEALQTFPTTQLTQDQLNNSLTPASLDEVGIWKRKLTDLEMEIEWNSGFGISYP